MGAFSIALTGLKANTVALNTIGNNLANLNTVAFKGATTEFEDLFYQQLGESGSGNALQSGLGTRVSGTVGDFSQGGLTTTNNATDMALNGDGFFVIQDHGQQQITRAGDFQLAKDGYLTTLDGASVMGFQSTDGVTVGTGGALAAIQLPIGSNQAASTTKNVGLRANLDSSAATGTTFASSVSVYDSLGNTHLASVKFTKTSNTTWDYDIELPAGDITGTPSNNTGTLTFDSTGKLTGPSSNVTGITFPGLTNSAADLSFNWSLYDGSGNGMISSSSSASATASTSQDGYASGTYQNFSIDSNGIISAKYSNGRSSVVGQLAIATVSDTQGLTRVGNNSFISSQASGLPSIGVAGSGGRGTVLGNSLEQSNVDIAGEFSRLIVAQRAFEANSKTVTAYDTLTQSAINMIR